MLTLFRHPNIRDWRGRSTANTDRPRPRRSGGPAARPPPCSACRTPGRGDDAAGECDRHRRHRRSVSGRRRRRAVLGQLRDAASTSITRFSNAELEDTFPPRCAAPRTSFERAPSFPTSTGSMRISSASCPRDAALTDPQHRLLLECAWSALEDAGCDPAHYPGPIGVFAGCSLSTYLLTNVLAGQLDPGRFASEYQVGSYDALLGALPDTLATRIAYRLNLRGPAVTVQSACSTSLLAVAQACQSLLLGQSDMALAGGVSITFPQKRGYLHQEGGMVSADGSCRPFDDEATGTVFGDGVAVVAAEAPGRRHRRRRPHLRRHPRHRRQQRRQRQGGLHRAQRAGAGRGHRDGARGGGRRRRHRSAMSSATARRRRLAIRSSSPAFSKASACARPSNRSARSARPRPMSAISTPRLASSA